MKGILANTLALAVLLAAVSGIVSWHPFPSSNTPRIAAAHRQIDSLLEAAELYRRDTGSVPSELRALQEPPSGVDGWAGPYLPREIPLDPWGSPFVYSADGPTITSLGADRRPGGEGSNADIVSSKNGSI